MASHGCGSVSPTPPASSLSAPPVETRRLRVVTYNVHSCVGVDRKRSEDRIADVLEKLQPDVVGLQELDAKRKRSGGVDQAARIADRLGYEFAFHPALETQGEEYGDAILSRLPFRVFRNAPLPYGPHFLFRETRGALGVELLDSGIRVINTHLGLGKSERLAQAKALAGDSWMGANGAPVILLGDFNSLRGSPFRVIAARLKDAGANGTWRNRASYPSSFPAIAIDHVFPTPHFTVKDFSVPNDPQTRIASDHLPVMVLLEYKPQPLAEISADRAHGVSTRH